MVLKCLDIRVLIHTDRFNNVLQTGFSPHNKIEKRRGKKKTKQDERCRNYEVSIC